MHTQSQNENEQLANPNPTKIDLKRISKNKLSGSSQDIEIRKPLGTILEKGENNSSRLSLRRNSSSLKDDISGKENSPDPDIIKFIEEEEEQEDKAGHNDEMISKDSKQTSKLSVADENTKNNNTNIQNLRKSMVPGTTLLRVRRDNSELTYRPIIRKRRIFNDSSLKNETTTIKTTTSIKKSKTQDWNDLDISEKNDTCMVVEYTNDIFDYLYKRELETMPTFNYTLDKTSKFYLRPQMRSILVDWLVEVHEKFNCYTETLYLAINLMDRFLSKNKVTLKKLQLLAVTSLFIAAKFEEINVPKLAEYAYITDGAATKQDIKDAEMFMLSSLGFNIAWPNPINFLRRISKVDNYDYQTRNFAKFLLEYSLCSTLFIGVKSSVLAAMSMFVARRITNRNDLIWDNTFKHYSGGIDSLNDETFQKNCKLLIKDIAHPSTRLEALTLKFSKQIFDKMYIEIYHWCQDQVDSDYEGLLSS